MVELTCQSGCTGHTELSDIPKSVVALPGQKPPSFGVPPKKRMLVMLILQLFGNPRSKNKTPRLDGPLNIRGFYWGLFHYDRGIDTICRR